MQIIVDAIHPTADGLLLAVYDHDVTGVATVLGISDIIIGKAYPNPVTDQVQLWIITPEAKTIDVEVITITGEPVVSKTIRLSGKGLMTLPMTSASSGLYFLVIKSGDGRILNTQKIIKN